MRETRRKEKEVAKARKKQAKLERRAAKSAEIEKTEPRERPSAPSRSGVVICSVLERSLDGPLRRIMVRMRTIFLTRPRIATARLLAIGNPFSQTRDPCFFNAHRKIWAGATRGYGGGRGEP
jgi:hypothetical protein